MLPNDIARCKGVTIDDELQDMCVQCRRRTEQGGEMQWYLAPLFDGEPDDYCEYRIEP